MFELLLGSVRTSTYDRAREPILETGDQAVLDFDELSGTSGQQGHRHRQKGMGKQRNQSKTHPIPQFYFFIFF